MRRLFLATPFVLAATATFAPLAQAQQSTGTAMTPDEIAACTCQEQAIDQQRSELDIQAGILGERQQELDNLDKEIKRQALAASPTDEVAQSVLQSMISQQIALRNLIQLRIRPDYGKQARALTETVNAYNAQCTSRPRYMLDVEKAQENLVCPKP